MSTQHTEEIAARAKLYGEAESAKALSILCGIPVNQEGLSLLLASAYLSGTIDGARTVSAIRRHEPRPMDDDGIAAC